MSHTDYRPDQDDLDDVEFEQALRALQRRRVVTAASVAVALLTLLSVPWTQSIDASGRVAPARWARCSSSC